MRAAINVSRGPAMDPGTARTLLDPAILFFCFGIAAGALRSNLEIPPALAKGLSLFLLMSVGFKGGVALAHTGITATALLALGAAMLLALAIPLYSFLILRRRLNPFDAAAVAATYGSVSAVTFITAAGFAERAGVPYGGHMAVALVVMESPAIIMAVLLAAYVRNREQAHPGAAGAALPLSLRRVLHEAFTDGAHLLLLGSLVIGFVTGDDGKKAMDPLLGQLQKGVLAFFLLDMGLLVAARARSLRTDGAFLAAFGVLMPLVNASLAAGMAWAAGLGLGDAFLLTVLAASASYIVVPAVLRYAVPEANAGLYFGMALVITFPFNIVVGLPLYFAALSALWR
jgi:uncharacterized protein